MKRFLTNIWPLLGGSFENIIFTIICTISTYWSLLDQIGPLFVPTSRHTADTDDDTNNENERERVDEPR